MNKNAIMIILLLVAIAAVIVGTFGYISHYSKYEAKELAVLWTEGEQYLDDREFKEAEKCFKHIVAVDQYNVDAFMRQADAYVGMGKYDKAEKTLQKALGIQSNRIDIQNRLALIDSIRMGDFTSWEYIDEVGPDFFHKACGVTEIDGKIITVGGEGIHYKDAVDMSYQIVTKQPYDINFVTNGDIVICADQDSHTIDEVDLESGEITTIVDVNDSYFEELYEYSDDEDVYLGDILIQDCCGYYIYYWVDLGGLDLGAACLFDWSNPDNKRFEGDEKDSISIMGHHNSKIYYGKNLTEEGGWHPYTLYEADADGSNERVFIKNVLNCGFIGDYLYYQKWDSKDSAYNYEAYINGNVKDVQIRRYSFKTDLTDVVLTKLPRSTQAVFSDFGFAVGDAQHGRINLYDLTGEKQVSQSSSSFMEFLSAEPNCISWESSNVKPPNYTVDGKSIDSMDSYYWKSYVYVIGIYGEKLYYAVLDENTMTYYVRTEEI